MSRVTPSERELFDRLLQQVIAELPPRLQRLLEEVPVIVDDAPTPQILHRLGLEDDEGGALCGLYTGIPLTRKSVEHSGVLPDAIHLFRDGVLDEAADKQGYVSDESLLRQVRVTLLHEMGHHFGLDEADLRGLGYG